MPLPFSRDVPILGQGFRVVASWPVVVIECGCSAKSPMVLTQPNAKLACPACRKEYAILDEMQIRVADVSSVLAVTQ